MKPADVAIRLRLKEIAQADERLAIEREAAKLRTLVTGPQGPQGETGPEGKRGAEGAASVVPGPPGATGVDGRDGTNGVDGKRGVQGMQGTQGPKGDAGPQGPAGAQGPVGDIGEGFRWRGHYEQRVQYEPLDVVEILGSSWVAVSSTRETPGASADWNLMAQKGQDGLNFGGGETVLAGAGMTKTGSTVNVIANADGSIVVNADDVQVGVLATDAQHGARGGGTQHAAAVAGGASGFLTGADKTKLDAISGTNTGNVTIGTANGLSLSGQALSLAPAVAAGSGGALTGADKTKIDAITGTNTGDVTIGTANGLSVSGQAVSLATAVAGGANGAFLGSDKTKLDAITGSHTGTNTGDVTIGTANGLSLSGQALSLAAAVAAGASGALTGADKTKLDNTTNTNSGDVALAAVGSSANANGASLSGQALTLQPASASFPGVVTTGAQTIAGDKTLSGTISVGTALLPSSAGGAALGSTSFKWGSVYATDIRDTNTIQRLTWAAGGGTTLRSASTSGSAATGITFDNSNAFTHVGSKLFVFNNQSVEKLSFNKDGKFVYPASGAADVRGTATLAAGTKVVSTTAIEAGDVIFLTRNTPGGTVGDLSAPVASIIAATSFVINSASGSDTSTVNWWIVK